VVHSAQVCLVVQVFPAVLVVHSAKAGLVVHLVQTVFEPALVECTTKTA
jgi:hypothetical protein